MNQNLLPLGVCALVGMPFVLSADTVAEASFNGMSASNVTTPITPAAGANDLTWTLLDTSGTNFDILTDPSGINSGEALQVDASSSFRGTLALLASPLDLALGETISFSFTGRFPTAPPNNGSGFRIGFSNSGDLDQTLFATVGTGGTADLALRLDDTGTGGDDSPGAGNSFAITATASGSAIATLGTTPFTGSFSVTRNASDYTVVANVNGSIRTGNSAGFPSFDSIVIRNGNMTADFLVDDLVVSRTLPPTMTRTYTYSGGSLTVNYALHSARGPGFEVYTQDAGGGFTAFTPTRPARTYLGRVVERPGAIAVAQMRDDGSLRSTIIFEDGTQWRGTGLSMSIPSAASFTPIYPTSGVSSGGAGSSVYAADMAYDITPAYYSLLGSNTGTALEMVEYCMMEVNAVYLRDAAILHRIGRVVVRTSTADDPYAGNADMYSFLPDFRDHWNGVMPGLLPATSYDLAAGIRPGMAGGLAYTNGVTTSSRYSVNNCDGAGNFTSYLRHEAGHNWGSSHYEGGGKPEGPTIMSDNSLSRFSSSELAKIIGQRTSKAASFDNLGSYTYPLPPRANGERTQLNPSHSAVTFDVLANDSDSNGEALTILSFDSSSNKGGTITRSVGTGPGGRDQLVYTPSGSFSPTSAAIDWFRYRIEDASGQQATGLVTIKAAAQPAAPWTGGDVGSTGVAGSSYYEGSTYTLNGAGADIYGTTDGFRFVYQTLSGDGEIVARVASIENTNGWAKSGVMIRESLSATAKNVFMGLSPSNGFFSQVRDTTGGSTVNTAGVGGAAPGWVKLVRSGSSFTTYRSTDGATWTLMATYTVSMGSDVYIGLATSSHSTSTLCTATFDNVTVSSPLPPVWAGGDIGAVGAAGTQTYNSASGSYTVDGSGADVWSTADEFHYVYQSLSGDGEITARVASVENTSAWAKAGVMIRESLAAGSAHAMVVITPGNGVAFQRRVSTGGVSTNTNTTGITAPRWVKINRTGNTLTTYHSANGTSWTTVGSETITMAANIYIGLAVVSTNDGTLCTAVFDNVSVTP